MPLCFYSLFFVIRTSVCASDMSPSRAVFFFFGSPVNHGNKDEEDYAPQELEWLAGEHRP